MLIFNSAEEKAKLNLCKPSFFLSWYSIKLLCQVFKEREHKLNIKLEFYFVIVTYGNINSNYTFIHQVFSRYRWMPFLSSISNFNKSLRYQISITSQTLLLLLISCKMLFDNIVQYGNRQTRCIWPVSLLWKVWRYCNISQGFP